MRLWRKKNEFVSIAAAGGEDRADRVRITNADIRMNEYYDPNGNLVSFPRINASFVSKVKKEDMHSEATFTITMVVGHQDYKYNQDGEPVKDFFGNDKYIVTGLVPQYGGRLDKIDFICSNENVVNAVRDYWEVGSTVKASGRLNFSSTTETTNKTTTDTTSTETSSSEIDLNAFKIKSVSIDINTQMELVYNETKKTIDFKDINFNGDSAKESENLQDNIIQLDYLVELNDAQFVGYNKNYFIINGTLDSPIALTNDKLVSMSFMNITGKNKECKTYNCIVNMDKKNNLLISLGCDVDNNPINTTINYLHLSSGISSGNNILVIKMKDLSDMPIEFPIKNESGLNITANYPPFDIDENSKISKESKKIDNKDALLQIVKFYNYAYDEKNNIQFISDFYFSGIKIMKEITFRLNVFYENTGIRRLDLAESIQSTCSLREEDLIMTYYIGNGKIYNYTCKATPNKNISNIKKVKINTDIPMIAAGIDGYEIIDFRDINFKGNSFQESENLNEIITINKKAELKKAYIIIVERDYFKIGGVLDNNETIKDNVVFMHYKKKLAKK